eukprot:ANDGO_08581.mRNA.1 eRF1 methyltransferase catalytic subunit MTQ2
MPSKYRPKLDHISFDTLKEIYDPSDDTFLFSDVLEEQQAALSAVLPGICLEIGPATGYLTCHLAHMFPESHYVSVDVNPIACATCSATYRENQVSQADVVHGDLVTSLCDSSVDVVIFNPPYVPSEEDELGTQDVIASYAGGWKGRVVIDRFVTLVFPKLRSSGLLYLLVIRENEPLEVIENMKRRGFLDVAVVGEQKRGWEHQFIIRARKP